MRNPVGRSRLQIIRDAAVEVRKPTMFGELIIMIVYLPILALEGVEGKLFRPMALTVIFALAGSMVLSLTLMPVLGQLGASQADRRARAAGDPRAQAALCPGPAVHDAPQAGRARACRVPAGGCLRDDCSQPGIGVHSQALRRFHRRQHHPAGGNRPGGIDPLQHRRWKRPS